MKMEGTVFLTKEELILLTKYKQKTKQREHLAKEGIKFKVARDGSPLVLKEAVIFELLPKSRQAFKLINEPNLAGLKEWSNKN